MNELPVTDMEHVMREINAQRWADGCIRRTRHSESIKQNVYRQIRKERSDEATK